MILLVFNFVISLYFLIECYIVLYYENTDNDEYIYLSKYNLHII